MLVAGHWGGTMRLAVCFALLFAALLSGLPGCRPSPAVCAICDRPIHAEMTATVILADGRRLVACCPRCALHHRDAQAAGVRGVEVTDHAGGGPLPMDRAFLVDGSDLTPCLGHAPKVDPTGVAMHTCYDRCVPSLIAFKDGTAARAFIADHGGTLQPPAAAGP
jgi:hypothetical protein